MSEERPYVLTIGGNDPSAGAGILADIKTFEQCGVYGLGVVSAITYQDDRHFEKVEWMSAEQILGQLKVLQRRFEINWIKIGLVESPEFLLLLLEELTKDPGLKIIWDPVLRSSTGFTFHREIELALLHNIARKLWLITPNIPEALALGSDTAEKNAEQLSRFCNVYLKGGHSDENPGTDFLFQHAGAKTAICSDSGKLNSKHGSGCVFSSALLAALAKGDEPGSACRQAKAYTEDFLKSNSSLLGYHSGIKTEIYG
jgi:hydroxymethylpyrimidine/phosphomethylpyrimidine kinase